MKNSWTHYYPDPEFLRTENDNIEHPFRWLWTRKKETPKQFKAWQKRWSGSWYRPQPSDKWYKILGATYFVIFVFAIVLSKVM